MTHEFFSQTWAEAFREQINRNPEYRRSARGWQQVVALVLEPAPEVPRGRHLLLDLFEDECRSVRAVKSTETESAAFIVSGPAEAWRQIFLARSDPILALMQGRLKLVKGAMFGLARGSTAAKQLVHSATRVPTRFPGEADSPWRAASTPRL